MVNSSTPSTHMAVTVDLLTPRRLPLPATAAVVAGTGATRPMIGAPTAAMGGAGRVVAPVALAVPHAKVHGHMHPRVQPVVRRSRR